IPEWFTPLLRVLVAMPSFGNCSTRKTSCHFFETASAIAHPITPPPMIRIFAWSINPFFPCALSVSIDFIEKRFAFNEPRLRAVMHRVHRVLLFLVVIAPKRCRTVHAVLVQRVEENVKRRELLLVAVVIAGDARQRFKARLLGRFPAPHHFNNRVPAGNLDVFLAFPR